MSWTPSEITALIKEVLSPTLPVLGTIMIALIAKGVKDMSEREDETGGDMQNASHSADAQSALIMQIVQLTSQVNELKRDLEKAKSREKNHA